jgi:3-oxoacyl-[acyl-carrier protein] reductase
MDTPMSKGVMGRFPDRVLSKILLNRPAKLEEVASVALFLASDRASYITGQVIRVDGGFGLNF